MSRVAKKIIDLPQGVTATVANEVVTVKGAKGSLTLPLKSGVKVELKDKRLEVEANAAVEGLNAIAGPQSMRRPSLHCVQVAPSSSLIHTPSPDVSSVAVQPRVSTAIRFGFA